MVRSLSSRCATTLLVLGGCNSVDVPIIVSLAQGVRQRCARYRGTALALTRKIILGYSLNLKSICPRRVSVFTCPIGSAIATVGDASLSVGGNTSFVGNVGGNFSVNGGEFGTCQVVSAVPFGGKQIDTMSRLAWLIVLPFAGLHATEGTKCRTMFRVAICRLMTFLEGYAGPPFTYVLPPQDRHVFPGLQGFISIIRVGRVETPSDFSPAYFTNCVVTYALFPSLLRSVLLCCQPSAVR